MGGILGDRAGGNALAVVGEDPGFPVAEQSAGRVQISVVVAVVENAGDQVVVRTKGGFRFQNQFDFPSPVRHVPDFRMQAKQSVSDLFRMEFCT